MWPNHALQRTGAVVTSAASCLLLSPPRSGRASGAIAELGVVTREDNQELGV